MIAITGAGEYLDIIRPYDEILLNKLKDDPYVLCFPTAAGLESNERIQYWLDLGDDHFTKLNVNHKSIRALNVDDYNKPETLAEIEKANFIYFSGGNPNHLYDTLSSSLAWEKLLNIHNNGGILAGCSAGAMIMGEKMNKGKGFGFFKNSMVLPHWNEVLYKAILSSSKQIHKSKYKILGLEMNTYLVLNDDKLEVIGDQNVHIMHKKDEHTYENGDVLELSVLDI